MDINKEALEYHRARKDGRAGKIGTEIFKSSKSQKDLSLAYSPGVAAPCLEISKNPEKAYEYTNKGNSVAVISNGSAVLGLGNIGAIAGKPVMEGKALLFKHFSNIDAVDVLVDTQDADKFIEVVELISTTYGGINLEDIKAPECFYIEDKLKKILDIPVFHDDQHGTAIVVGAGLLNALEIVDKKIENVKIVFSGAGAAGIACAKMLLVLGAKKDNITKCDSKGIIHLDRDVHDSKKEFAIETKLRTLEEALNNTDVFIGVSKKDILSPKMLLSMNKNPIVFALSNPNPEIDYDLAKKTRNDIIISTGRSDYPNQVNNVLAFPSIFRAALDVRAKKINDKMKIAAVFALAKLAKEKVDKDVMKIYKEDLKFGRDYILPKPFDKRVVVEVSLAVAQAAIESGVASKGFDLDKYRLKLEKRFLWNG